MSDFIAYFIPPYYRADGGDRGPYPASDASEISERMKHGSVLRSMFPMSEEGIGYQSAFYGYVGCEENYSYDSYKIPISSYAAGSPV